MIHFSVQQKLAQHCKVTIHKLKQFLWKRKRSVAAESLQVLNVMPNETYFCRLLLQTEVSCFCCSSITKLRLTLCNPMDCSTPGFPGLQSLPEFAQIHVLESVMLSNHLILCRPLLLLPSIFPSTRVFSSESALHIRWPKYRSFSISPSNEYSGLISFRIDWFDLLDAQGTLRSLLQHQSISSSVLSLLYGPTLTSIHDY